MTRYRLLLVVVLGVVAAYIVTSPETATAGAADFGNWLVGGIQTATDSVIDLVGGLL